ncbi:hypothetical protein [Kingella oralis]|uniref:hypothetical protein n=1 Tax=Kingella oralis TaxID=505 RepID=UPI0034E5A350
MSDTQLFIRALGSLKIVSPLSGCLQRSPVKPPHYRKHRHSNHTFIQAIRQPET